MLLSAQTGALGALLGPNPLAGTPYSTEHDSASRPIRRYPAALREQLTVAADLIRDAPGVQTTCARGTWGMSP